MAHCNFPFEKAVSGYKGAVFKEAYQLLVKNLDEHVSVCVSVDFQAQHTRAHTRAKHTQSTLTHTKQTYGVGVA